MYSTIEKKRCKHRGCFNMPKMGAGGFCWEHEEEDIAFKRKQARIKDKAALRKITSSNNFVDNKAAKEFQELQNWYKDKEKFLSEQPFCQCCKCYIPPKYFRAAIAHILPKRKEFGFPSISTHPMNFLFLCSGNGCHQKYDSSWETASKMNIWYLAVEAVKEIYPFIAQSELKNLPDILRKEIKT